MTTMELIGRISPPRGGAAKLQMLIATLAMVLLSGGGAFGQCTVCGDYNNGGTNSSADVVGMVNYLYKDGASPVNPDCADADNYAGITWRDAIRMWELIFIGGPGPVCPPANGPISPQANTTYFVTFDDTFPADSAKFTMRLNLEAADSLLALWLPLRIRVDGQIPSYDSISTFAPAGFSEVKGGDIVLIASDPPPGDTTVPSSNYPLAEIELTMPPVAFDRSITVETGVGYPGAEQPAMILGMDKTAWDPNLLTTAPCTQPVAGDVNTSGVITSADIIFEVNYVFKSGASPLPCTAAGDVNCDRTVTSSDIISLVNFTFKGGPEPCKVCLLIASGAWTCP